MPLLRERDWDRTAEVYLCGAPNCMRQVRRVAVVEGIAPDKIHYEVFTPDPWFGFD